MSAAKARIGSMEENEKLTRDRDFIQGQWGQLGTKYNKLTEKNLHDEAEGIRLRKKVKELEDKIESMYDSMAKAINLPPPE